MGGVRLNILAILKEIRVRNNDTDTTGTITFEFYPDNVSLNELQAMKHTALNMTLVEDDG